MKKFGKRLVVSAAVGASIGVASFLAEKKLKKDGKPGFKDRIEDAWDYLKIGGIWAFEALRGRSPEDCDDEDEVDMEDIEPAPEEETGWSCPEAREEFFGDASDAEFDKLMERFDTSEQPVFDSEEEEPTYGASDGEEDEFGGIDFGSDDDEENEEPDESGVELLDKEEEDECAESSDEDFKAEGTVIPFPKSE